MLMLFLGFDLENIPDKNVKSIKWPTKDDLKGSLNVTELAEGRLHGTAYRFKCL